MDTEKNSSGQGSWGGSVEQWGTEFLREWNYFVWHYNSGYVIIYLLKPIECKTQRVNYGLSVMMGQCRFNVELWGKMLIVGETKGWEQYLRALLSAQFFLKA